MTINVNVADYNLCSVDTVGLYIFVGHVKGMYNQIPVCLCLGYDTPHTQIVKLCLKVSFSIRQN